MDFFAHQAQARRRTALLALYFVLALLALIAALYGVLVVLLPFLGVHTYVQQYGGALWQPALLRAVAIGTVAVVVAGSLYRMWTLRAGGAAVAEALGGVRLESEPRTLLRRRLLNVVEEMAIASGVPRPAIYVLPDEAGINAFAAGHDWGDAAIAVSDGALRALDRAELQGVIAHEFSHIVHGDMRLNLRLLGLLHGIQMIALGGEFLLRGLRPRAFHRPRRADGAGALLGAALFVIGWLGVFFATLIKAAVSRQREFLADASAVQYTRNPDGIGGALAKIGGFARGASLHNPREREISHFLFAHGEDGAGPHWMDRLLATHPSLAERLARIHNTDVAQWRRGFPEVTEADLTRDEALPDYAIAQLDAAAVVAPIDGRVPLAVLPTPLREALREPSEACALSYALLISTDPETMQLQHQHLQAHADRNVYRALWRVGAEVRGLAPDQVLPLIELLAGTLGALSERQYLAFRADIEALIEADGRLDLREFAVRQILLRHLDRRFGLSPEVRLRHRDLLEVLGPLALALSTFAWFGHGENEAAARAAFRATIVRLELPASTPLMTSGRCTLRALGYAFDAFRGCLPELRARIVDACITVIEHDGRVTPAEGVLIATLRAALDLPAEAR